MANNSTKATITRKHDGKPVPIELWGRDHESTMLYIESRCVDNGGVPLAANMRTGSGRFARGDMSHGAPPGGKDYPTRLGDGSELHDHDDWDCVDDLVEAGLIEWQGTGANPVFVLTDIGWAFAGLLRRKRAEKGKVKTLQDMFGQATKSASAMTH